MKKMTNDTKKNNNKDNDIQYDFFFWLGAEGEVESVSEEEFKMKQETWNGQRPSKEEGIGG